MTDVPPIALHWVAARCNCGREFHAHTLRPPVPGQAPIDRKCDECVEAAFRHTPTRRAAPKLDDDGPLAPPKKVFGYD